MVPRDRYFVAPEIGATVACVGSVVIPRPVSQRCRGFGHHLDVKQRIGWFRGLVAAIGAWIIYRLIWLFGRTPRRDDVAWLLGPMGGRTIGDTPYQEVADAEGLSIERHAKAGGLVPSFTQLDGDGFAGAD